MSPLPDRALPKAISLPSGDQRRDVVVAGSVRQVDLHRPIRVHHMDLVVAVRPADEGDPLAVGRPDTHHPVRDLGLAGSVLVDDQQTLAEPRVQELRAVRRPDRAEAVEVVARHSRRARSVGVHRPDVEVVGAGEGRERDRRAIRRQVGHQPCGPIWRSAREPSAAIAQIRSVPPAPMAFFVYRMSPWTAGAEGATDSGAAAGLAEVDAAGAATDGPTPGALPDGPPGDAADPQPTSPTVVAATVARTNALPLPHRRIAISSPSLPSASPGSIGPAAHPRDTDRGDLV